MKPAHPGICCEAQHFIRNNNQRKCPILASCRWMSPSGYVCCVMVIWGLLRCITKQPGRLSRALDSRERCLFAASLVTDGISTMVPPWFSCTPWMSCSIMPCAVWTDCIPVRLFNSWSKLLNSEWNTEGAMGDLTICVDNSPDVSSTAWASAVSNSKENE